MTLCVINNIPSPYRRALFDRISDITKAKGIQFSVLYLSRSERARNWVVDLKDFEAVLPVVCQRRNPMTTTSDVVINYGFISKGLRPRQVVLFGYNYFTYLAVAVLRAIFRRPTSLFCETTLSDKPSSAWKKAIKSMIFKHLFDGFLVPGQRSAEYLEAHGVSSDKIFTARNASPMEPEVPNKPSHGPGLRILFVGRLAPEKKIVDFARVFSEVEREDRLTIVGSGPEARHVAEVAKGASNIDVLGSREPHELSRVYAEHDVLALVSESEPWGMVVNEAINHGLALLLSTNVGSAPDLLDGNGTYLEDFSPYSLSVALDELRSNLNRLRSRSFEIASYTTVEQQALAFIDFIEEAENAGN